MSGQCSSQAGGQCLVTVVHPQVLCCAAPLAHTGYHVAHTHGEHPGAPVHAVETTGQRLWPMFRNAGASGIGHLGPQCGQQSCMVFVLHGHHYVLQRFGRWQTGQKGDQQSGVGAAQSGHGHAASRWGQGGRRRRTVDEGVNLASRCWPVHAVTQSEARNPVRRPPLHQRNGFPSGGPDTGGRAHRPG